MTHHVGMQNFCFMLISHNSEADRNGGRIFTNMRHLLYLIHCLLWLFFFFSITANLLVVSCDVEKQVVFSWRWKATLESKRKFDSSFITSQLSIMASVYNQFWNSSTCYFSLKFAIQILGPRQLKKSFSSL